jgi:opacity protein-like surface antigen
MLPGILVRAAALLVFAATLAAPAAAQSPSPTPPPERLLQDALDLLARSSVVQGSGARAFGMAGAFLARADDATAASWNPAGLSYLKLPELSMVWTRSSLKSVVVQTDPTAIVNDKRAGSAPDFVAFAYPYDLRSASGSVQLSFQRVISFTANRTIDDPALFRTIRSSGGFDVLAFGTGLRLTRKLRVGAVVNHWFNGYRQTIEKPGLFIPSRQDQDFSLSGWNAHLGVIYSPLENLNLGATFKTQFSSSVTLRRSRVDRFPPVLGGEDTTNAFSRSDLELRLPGAVGFGTSWRPRSNLTLSLDYTRSFWSKARILNFFTLQRRNPGAPAPVPKPPDDFFPQLPWPTLNDPKQQDTAQLRAGIEYVVLKHHLRWPLRAGYFTDRQYFRSFDGSAPTFDGFTAGTGLIVGRFLLDVAYVHEYADYRDLDGDATSVSSNRFYASVIYRHPRKP